MSELTRDFRKEMFACIIGAFKHGPHSVLVEVSGGQDGQTQESQTTIFKCKPAANGGVILYKGNERKQYHHMTMDEWIDWAQKYDVTGVPS